MLNFLSPLVSKRCDCKLKQVIFTFCQGQTDILGISCEIAFKWMPQHFTVLWRHIASPELNVFNLSNVHLMLPSYFPRKWKSHGLVTHTPNRCIIPLIHCVYIPFCLQLHTSDGCLCHRTFYENTGLNSLPWTCYESTFPSRMKK